MDASVDELTTEQRRALQMVCDGMRIEIHTERFVTPEEVVRRTSCARDGIYFGLPHDEYRRDPALGSSDIKALRSPLSWWWHSGYNPDRPAEGYSAARTLGTATHDLVLHGREVFDARYCRRSDRPEGALATGDELKAWLKARGLKVSGKRADLVARVREADASVRIWDGDDAGRTALPEAHYDRALLIDQCLRASWLGDAVLGPTEVSVFWTERGVRLKARFDALRPDYIFDLKTIGDTRGRSQRDAMVRAISEHRYDMQAEHYLNAAGTLPQFLDDGRIHGELPSNWASIEERIKEAGPPDRFLWAFAPTEGVPAIMTAVYTSNRQTAEEIAASISNYKWLMGGANVRDELVAVPFPEEITRADLPPWV